MLSARTGMTPLLSVLLKELAPDSLAALYPDFHHSGSSGRVDWEQEDM